MSVRWFYEIDGREGGPISTVQLQLMANSGMLQPLHKIRKENSDQWSVAGDVRGLFAPTAVPQAYPVSRQLPIATPASPTPPVADNPLGWPAPTAATEPDNAFDFFSESPAPAVAAPPPAPAPKAKGNRKHRPPVNESTPPPPPPVEENPFSFGEEPAAPPAQSSAVPKAVPTPAAPRMREPAGAAGTDDPFEFESTPLDVPPTVRQTEPMAAASAAPAPASRPVRSHQPAKKSPSPAQTLTTPSGGTPAVVVEVTGRAVELLPDDEVRLLEGTTVFRLHRAWVYVSTRLADETTRAVYLPLHRIDAAILDHRYEASRKKGEPQPLLIFQSGAVAVGLVIQGNDKPYRNFLEKVLLLANPARHVGGKQ
ncbi:MAG TPA: GYF domain-containing protein [Gemmataceae bacterium]|nr:GYF domain-containing protein [Gemmataceae bacterium]